MEGPRVSGENEFSLPVDSEQKATKLRIYSAAAPHMRAFHLSWIPYFACFVSSFAAPPLVPVIRDNINLTATDIGNAGIAAVSGAIFARNILGITCDLFGPRLASTSLLLITAPAIYCFSVVESATTFVLVRFFVGFSLATFVSNQFWMSSMFSPKVVGTANAFAAGWGNLGGGATQLIMPLVFELLRHIGATTFTAWRLAFFVPGLFQTLIAYAVFFLGQDLPHGNFAEVKKTGQKHTDNVYKVFLNAISNYRAWILALTYGYCFGVELTIDNIIANYFYDRFGLNLSTAGSVAASFGLMNLVSRPSGGMLSDFMAKKFGMRGRLWALWTFQTLGGIFCILSGKVNSLSASIALVLIFSFFVQSCCGLTFGIAPFISLRSLGVVSGMIGSGGNLGSLLTQLIFFRGDQYSTELGITLMGVMIVCFTALLPLVYFPQWGGMFFRVSSGATEEDYYMSEWSPEEKSHGFHMASLKFSENSVGERGKRVAATPRPTET